MQRPVRGRRDRSVVDRRAARLRPAVLGDLHRTGRADMDDDDPLGRADSEDARPHRFAPPVGAAQSRSALVGIIGVLTATCLV